MLRIYVADPQCPGKGLGIGAGVGLTDEFESYDRGSTFFYRARVEFAPHKEFAGGEIRLTSAGLRDWAQAFTTMAEYLERTQARVGPARRLSEKE